MWNKQVGFSQLFMSYQVVYTVLKMIQAIQKNFHILNILKFGAGERGGMKNTTKYDEFSFENQFLKCYSLRIFFQF